MRRQQFGIAALQLWNVVRTSGLSVSVVSRPEKQAILVVKGDMERELCGGGGAVLDEIDSEKHSCRLV